ncbi:MAG TPA: MoxR family ATPase [Polyangiaceae bacterium]|nr:MoxR family ATPase [Polyangiaceae bacterium]
MNVEEVSATLKRLSAEIARVLVGQDTLIEHTLIGLLARGHLLIEGVPGLGKTLLVRCLGRVLGLSFRRIQFTPDLMPSDVTGSNVYSEAEGRFSFVPGPVFAQLVLADEINRAPAKTQSALLEAMQDRSVTVDGETRALPAPFLVLATQNPVESQGTYPLPEAQLDRFLLKLEVRHPTRQAEANMLKNYLAGFDPTDLGALTVLSSESHVLEMQRALGEVRVASEILDYITDIVQRTRSHPALTLGASPRASIALLCVARARALWEGRDFVTPDDVKSYAHAVLRHRLLLQPDAELEGTTADHCIDGILRDTVVPGTSA